MIEVNELSPVNRRDFIKQSAAAGVAVVAGDTLANAAAKQVFKISLAEWSLHKALFNKELDNLDFAKTAKQQFGISAIGGDVKITDTWVPEVDFTYFITRNFALELIAAGTDIDYVGASAVELIGPGESAGNYREIEVKDNKIETVKYR